MASTTMRRRAAAATAFASVLTAGAVTADAQAPVQPATFQASVAKGRAPAIVSTGVRPGVTRVVITSQATGDGREYELLRLKPGVTREAAAARLANGGKELTPNQIDQIAKDVGDFVDGGNARRGAARKAVLDLAAGTYGVLDVTDARVRSTFFDVAGNPTGAAAPAPSATIAMDEYSYGPSGTLPAGGTVRLTNAGEQLHMAIAFPARSAAAAKRLVATFKRGGRPAERLFGGPPSEPVALVSPGAQVDVPIGPRKGSVVLACFWASKASQDREHTRRGMVRTVKVR
ncbi:hypothetical protein [Conexibacter sp. SYSU D00693]|uniref:hypothetical protein n=1 Tax=Conexibacter sp. SYSU D00693 TaxID=2812560 RepID=UPI00196B208D|nr:hypothetical protein [Conexibacter sp. SYSU D00693]